MFWNMKGRSSFSAVVMNLALGLRLGAVSPKVLAAFRDALVSVLETKQKGVRHAMPDIPFVSALAHWMHRIRPIGQKKIIIIIIIKAPCVRSPQDTSPIGNSQSDILSFRRKWRENLPLSQRDTRLSAQLSGPKKTKSAGDVKARFRCDRVFSCNEKN